MAEQSAISWTDATFNPSPCLRVAPELNFVSEAMASLAEGNAVPNVKARFWELRERSNMMSVKIAAFVVAAMGTGESVAKVHIVPPSLQRRRRTQAPTLNALPIDIAPRVRTSRRAFTRYCANPRARLRRVSFTDPVAWSRLRRCAHFGAALSGHSFAFSHTENL